MTTSTQTKPLQLSVSNFGSIVKAEIDSAPADCICRAQQHGEVLLGNPDICTA